MGEVRVKSGIFNNSVDGLVGKTINYVKEKLGTVYNINPNAQVRLNNEPNIDTETILKEGDILEFVKPMGEKASLTNLQVGTMANIGIILGAVQDKIAQLSLEGKLVTKYHTEFLDYNRVYNSLVGQKPPVFDQHIVSLKSLVCRLRDDINNFSERELPKSKGNVSLEKHSERKSERMQISIPTPSGRGLFKSLLLIGLLATAGWAGTRYYGKTQFDNNVTTYVNAARKTSDLAKAEKYVSHANSYLVMNKLTEGRTDIMGVINGGPEADIGEWYTEMQEYFGRLKSKTEDVRNKAREEDFPMPPSGWVQDIAMHPSIDRFAQWLLIAIVSTILGSVGMVMTRRRNQPTETVRRV